ncbi:MAG: hypothetical protein Q9184_002988 [Pyrenodesmia sp. 2 TL-2023]
MPMGFGEADISIAWYSDLLSPGDISDISTCVRAVPPPSIPFQRLLGLVASHPFGIAFRLTAQPVLMKSSMIEIWFPIAAITNAPLNQNAKVSDTCLLSPG